ncbi:MAG: hypothetical protein ACM31E_06255 [Fibrobacterota bacterium]
MSDSKNNANRLLQEIAKTLAHSVASINIGTGALGIDNNTSPIDNAIHAESHVVKYLETIGQIQSNPKLQGLATQLSENEYSPFLIQEILIAIVTTGFSSDMSKEMHELTVVKKAITGNLMAVDRALLGLATLMESTLDTPVDIMRKTVIDNEEEIRSLQDHFTKYAMEYGTDANKISRFNSIFNQIFWRTRKQSGEALRGRCVTLVDKVAGRFGITPELRRELCKKLSTVKDYEQADRIMYAALTTGVTGSVLYEEFLAGNEYAVDELVRGQNDGTAVFGNTHSSGNKLVTIGMTLLGIGGVTLIGGFGIQSNGQDYGLLVITGGVVLLFLGLLALAGGAFSALVGLTAKVFTKKNDNLL